MFIIKNKPFLNKKLYSVNTNNLFPTSNKQLEKSREYCKNLLCKFDYSSYILKEFYSKNKNRDNFLALNCFNIETAKIPDIVTNTTIGKIRIQYWKDLINDLYNGKNPSSNDPISIMLSNTINSTNLSKSFFIKILRSRENRLTDPPFLSLNDIELYSEGTYSQLIYLILETLSIRSTKFDSIASHIGIANGISTVLRATTYLKNKKNLLVLPLDLCTKYSIKQEDVLRNGNVQGLQDCIFEIATRANDHVISARSLLAEYSHDIKSLGPSSFVPFLSVLSTTIFLKDLEKVNFDIFSPKLKQKHWLFPWNAYRAYTKMSF